MQTDRFLLCQRKWKAKTRRKQHRVAIVWSGKSSEQATNCLLGKNSKKQISEEIVLFTLINILLIGGVTW